MSANGHFVTLAGVSKRFGDNEVLHDIDLSVDLHQVVCLIGASGSGKSTLLRCLNLLEKVDAGTIEIDGQTITNGPVDVNALRQKIGIVFQAFNLFPHLTVLQNITLAPRKARGLSKRAADGEARELLGRIGLVEKANEFPDRLSGGQQQRVAIVRALAMAPKLMLLDEITSALDPQLVSEVLSLVRDLEKYIAEDSAQASKAVQTGTQKSAVSDVDISTFGDNAAENVKKSKEFIAGRAGCVARGFDKRGFFQVDTGNRLDYSQNLSD